MTSTAKFLLLVVWTSLLAVTTSQNDLSIVAKDTITDDTTIEEEAEVESEPFVPTHDWQPIREGQVIPAGLHVRINLETGLKEAKILDQNEDIDEKTEVVDKHKRVSHLPIREESDIKNIGQQIKRVLEDSIFAKTVNKSTTDQTSNSDFRSIDDIKKEFSEINIKMRSESEVLNGLIQRYNKSSNEEKHSLLSDIEYLVHSIDVARDLVKLGGIPLLIRDLNSTDSRLKAQIAFTVGSAMNANPRVQIEVLKSGALKEFLFLLSNDLSIDVKKKSLFAISSLVRQFPTAQKSLIKEYGALSIFAQFFTQMDINSIKLSAKVVTLLNDLFIERRMTSKYGTNDNLSQIKLKQYKEVELEQSIVDHGYCQLIPTLLNSPDTDIREKTIEAMNSLSVLCKQEFRQSLHHLRKIRDNYEVLAKNEINLESTDSYYKYLFDLSHKLINSLDSNLKDEL